MTIETLIMAFALFLILEGLGPALFPKQWQQYLLEISQLNASQLRIIGVSLILVGWLIFLWLRLN